MFPSNNFKILKNTISDTIILRCLGALNTLVGILSNDC